MNEYRNRAGAIAWIPAALLIGAMWFVLLATKRADHGLYASFRVRRPQAVLMVTAQLVTVAAPSVAASMTIALAIAIRQNFPRPAIIAMLNSAGTVTAGAMLACGLATWIALSGRIATQLKDR